MLCVSIKTHKTRPKNKLSASSADQNIAEPTTPTKKPPTNAQTSLLACGWADVHESSPTQEASAATWFNCLIEIPTDLSADWAPCVPPKRGGQKKEAMKRREQQEQTEQQAVQQQQQQQHADSTARPRSFPAHESMGSFSLTYAKTKSYMICSKPLPDEAAMVTQFTEGQVGALHPHLLQALAATASNHNLTRQEIKDLRELLVEKHKQQQRLEQPYKDATNTL